MIKNIEITGKKYEVENYTKKYIEKHIGKLDKYLPRHAKKSASAKVIISEGNGSHEDKYEVEVLLSVPDKVIVAKEQSSNVLAAIDIVEAKIEGQIRRYKTEKNPRLGKSGLMARFKRSFRRG